MHVTDTDQSSSQVWVVTATRGYVRRTAKISGHPSREKALRRYGQRAAQIGHAGYCTAMERICAILEGQDLSKNVSCSKRQRNASCTSIEL